MSLHVQVPLNTRSCPSLSTSTYSVLVSLCFSLAIFIVVPSRALSETLTQISFLLVHLP